MINSRSQYPTLLRAVLAVVAAVALLFAGVSAVSTAETASAAPTWSTTVLPRPTTPATASSVYLNSVSCPSSSFCVAVGYYNYTSGTDSEQAPVIETYNGTSWTQTLPSVATTQAYNTLTAVSCVSTSYCVAIGAQYIHTGTISNKPLVVTYSGGTWSSGTVLAAPGLTTITGISCAAVGACVAVGEYSGSPQYTIPVAYTLSGANWSYTSTGLNPSGQSGLTFVNLAGVSCTSSTACVAVGVWEGPDELGHPLVDTLSGTTWTSSTAASPSGASTTTTGVDLTDVECTSVGNCQAVGLYRNTAGDQVGFAESLSGGSWSVATSIAPTASSVLSQVSCTSASSCSAVGLDANTGEQLIETFDGTSWSGTDVADPQGASGAEPAAISCFSGGCATVGWISDDASQDQLAMASIQTGGATTPVVATHFVVSAPSSATAGTPVSYTVTAEDGSGATATGYSGTVRFTSSDVSAVLPANATLSNGVGTFSVTLKTAGGRTVTATDTASSSIAGTSSSITVAPAATTTLTLAAPSSATAGAPVVATVTAKDAYGNTATGYAGTIHFTSSDASAALPANATLSHGAGTFNVTFKTAGTHTVTATDTVVSSITATSGSVRVDTAAATQFTVSAPSTATAGTPISVTVTAKDPYGNTVTGYAGTVRLSSSDGNAALPADATLTNGTGAFNVTLTTASGQTITATDAATSSITGTSGSVAVGAAAVSQLIASAPATATAGTPVTVTVTAQDAYGNTATGYAGTVHLSSSDALATLPTTSQALSNGTAAFSVTLNTAASQTVTVTDTAVPALSATTGTIAVAPGAAALFIVSAPVEAIAGTPISVSITAEDAHGNTASGYTGARGLAFTGPAASPNGTLPTYPHTVTFTGGVAVAEVTFTHAGLTALDVADDTIGGSISTLTVYPADATAFVATAPAASVAGAALPVSLTAEDAYGNVATGYSGDHSIAFTGPNDAPDGTTPVYPTSVSFTRGQATASVNLVDAQTTTIAAADGGVTGTTGSVAVAPASAAVFAVSAPGTATAGTGIDVGISAHDRYGNIASGYAGTVHLTSTDAQATLPADTTLTSGAATVHVTLVTAGAEHVTASDAADATITGSSPAISVSAGAAASFSVSAPPSATGGTPFDVTIVAKDAYGNTADSFGGDQTLSFSGPGASPSGTAPAYPGHVVFTSGSGAASVTLFAAQPTIITVAHGAVSGTSAAVAVAPAPAASFTVTAPSTAAAGAPFTVSLVAHDPYGNVATGYSGTQALAFSGPHNASDGSRPAYPASVVFADGTGAASVTLAATEQTALTIGQAGITGTSAPITVTLTEPRISARVSSAHPKNAAGWYHSAVTVTFTCTPGSTPLLSCPKPVKLTHDSKGKTVIGKVTAQYGGAAQVTVAGIKLDTKAPAVKITGVKAGASYLRTAPKAHCKASDSVSGVASCTVKTHRVGNLVTITATAKDRAGNVTKKSEKVRISSSVLLGTASQGGTFSVTRNHTYTLVVVATQRPVLVNAAPAPWLPAGVGAGFQRIGTVHGVPEWAVRVKIDVSTRYRIWNLGYQLGGTLHTVSVVTVR